MSEEFDHTKLSPEENQKLLHEWNHSTLPFLPHYQNRCIQHLVGMYAEQNPNKLAVYHETYSLTYAELDKLSTQFSEYLKQNNVSSGDAVVVIMDRTPAILVAMLAIFKLGAIYIPLSPKYPEERIEFIISDSTPKKILIEKESGTYEKFCDDCILLNENFLEHEAFKNEVTTPSATTSTDAIAYIIYTSGTTGEPKGVMIKHISLMNLANWYACCFEIGTEDRSSQFASQGFDTFFCETIPFLANGASVHFVDDTIKLSPPLFIPWLVEQKITVCDLPISYAFILFALEWPVDISLRIVKIGGESVTQYPKQKLPFDIWDGYGPTEATVEATYAKIFEANVAPEQQSCKTLPPPIGKPIGNYEVYVVDKDLDLVPIGEIGELLIGGLGLATGYYNRPQLTREKFIRNLFSDDPNARLYKTGDLVRWLPDGNLEFHGRIDHQVKIRGYRIELDEIQTSLNQFPDVNEVIVLAREASGGQKSLAAYLVPNLDKIRIPYQERCLITSNDITFQEAVVEDFSKEGIAVSGDIDNIPLNTNLKINLKLPGMAENQWLNGHMIWKNIHRAGIKFHLSAIQKPLLDKSVNYYLSVNNLVETLRSSGAKRSLRKALRKKLPEFMIPSSFTILPEFPLTFNGKIDWKALPPPQDFDRLLERNYVEPRTKTEKTIASIWSEILNQENISITDNFFDLGGTSLLVSLLSVKIMQEFGIAIPAKVFIDLPFIPILAEYVDSNGKKYTYQTSVQNEIRHDSILGENIFPLQNLSITNLLNPRGILLTGAGGFLGIFLLRTLLQKTQAKIYCLVRRGDFETPVKRLMETAKRFGLLDDISLENRRIIVIASDLARDKFGISAAQYDNLADKVDLVYHCGAQVNTMASYSNLRGSNVQGTLEVIKFATYKIDKPIHYVSTLSSAYLLNEAGQYAEVFPDENSDELIGGYPISKWVSERLLTQIKNRGLPVCLYRSGYILGDSISGITNLNDALLLLLKGCIQMGYAPDWSEKITVLPANFVSEALVDISLYKPEKSGVFHLDHPTGMMWLDLIAWLNDYGYVIHICSHQEWRERLTQIAPDNALFSFLPQYLSMVEAPKTPETGLEKTTEILTDIGLMYPEITDELLTKYIDYLRQVGFFPAITAKKTSIT